MRVLRLSIFSCAIAAAVGCGETTPDPNDDAGAGADVGAPADAGFPEYTWYQHVEPIVREKCQLCHVNPPRFGALMPLVTYEDTQALSSSGNRIHEQMAIRIAAPSNPMPPASQQKRLTDDEKRIVQIWSLIGAPAGTPPAPTDAGTTPTDAGSTPTDAGTPDAGTPDAGSTPTDAGSTPTDAGSTPTDAGSTPTDAGSTPTDAGTPDAGNTPTDAGTPDAGTTPTDAGTPDAGPFIGQTEVFEIKAHEPNGTGPYALPQRQTNYVCFTLDVPANPRGHDRYATGFEYIIDNEQNTHHQLLFHNKSATKHPAGPFSCSDSISYGNMIAGWAPGHDNDQLPPNVGVKVDPGDQLILQIHYDNVTTGGRTDQSALRVTTVEASSFEQAGTLWSGVIWASPLRGVKTHVGECAIQRPITIFADFPHMHKYGTRIALEVKRRGTNTWTTLVDIPAWSFLDQPNIAIDPAQQQINPGDRLKTTCTWDTGNESVSFGEASDDEMCFNFIYHYPLMPNAGLGGVCTTYSL